MRVDNTHWNLPVDLLAMNNKDSAHPLWITRKIKFWWNDCKIHLYENLEKVTESSKANASTKTRFETEYYLQLPDEPNQDVYPLGGSKFVPNFDEKMSRIVSDCPSLSQKIAAKESGYFYAQVSLFNQKRLEVLMNIIREYNRCGR